MLKLAHFPISTLDNALGSVQTTSESTAFFHSERTAYSRPPNTFVTGLTFPCGICSQNTVNLEATLTLPKVKTIVLRYAIKSNKLRSNSSLHGLKQDYAKNSRTWIASSFGSVDSWHLSNLRNPKSTVCSNFVWQSTKFLCIRWIF